MVGVFENAMKRSSLELAKDQMNFMYSLAVT